MDGKNGRSECLMKKQWLEITLAFGLGLTSSAWAVKAAPGHPDKLAPVKVGHPSIEHLESLQLLAMAGGKAHTKIVGSGSLNAGIANFNRGYIARAIPCFEQAARQNPKNEMAFLWLARAHQKQGTATDMQRAKTAYQSVLNLNPNNVEALAALGEMWSWDPAMRGEAVALLKRANNLKPADAQISRHLAEALLWQGNAADALHYATPIADIFRNDKKWMGEYAQMLSSAGHADEAVQIYNTVLKDQNGDRNLYLRMDQARALFKSGERPSASILYEQISQSVAGKSIATNPDFVQAMGSLAFDLERYSDALQWDQSLPDAYQRHTDIQLREARALVKTGRVPEAIEAFNRLYQAGLLSVGEKLEFAEYLRVQHLAPEALPMPNLVETLYQEAIREASGDPDVELRLARYYADAGDRFEDAVKAYQTAVNSSPTNADAIRKEFLDFLKSDKSQPARVEALFKEMLSSAPDDVQTKSSYAEYLSWQKDRRVEAMRLYAELSKADPENRDVWQARIDEVLKWHVPTTELIPLYQEIVNLYPQDKAVWLTVARAYRNDKDYYKEAVETYGTLVQRFPDDGTIKREWLGLLLSNEPQRAHNIALLKRMVDKDPNDPDLLATYGKLLSYDHRYDVAMDAFARALQIKSNHREALVGKGYVILWSGRKLEARNYFQDLRKQYPDDVDVAIGLASAEKLNGRYDKAMQIIEEIRPLMDSQQQGQRAPQSSDAGFILDSLNNEFQLVDNWESGNSYQRRASYDFSILPYSNEDAATAETPAPVKAVTASPSAPVQAAAVQPVQAVQQSAISFESQFANGTFAGLEPMVSPLEMPAATAHAPTHEMDAVASYDHPTAMLAAPDQAVKQDSSNLNSLHAEIDAFASAVDSLKQAQQNSRNQLDSLGETIRLTNDAVPTEMNLQPEESEVAGALRPASAGGRHSVGESGMTKTYGMYNALDYDTNPLLSGVGRLRNDDLSNLEKGLTNDLRPMIRGGFLYSTRNGNATTTRLSSWGFPNQLSFSLTPQVRLRGGVSPTRYYLPNGLKPSSNWGTEYSVGGTVKYWDRLTLDGDFAVTSFSQTKNVNFSYLGQAQYAFNDSLRLKIGSSRLPQYNSLLSVAGQRPSLGFYRNQILGQARENSFFAELNTNPFNQNWDWNLGYSWAFVTGNHIPDNYKNQVFTSLGHKWQLGANHQLHLGYEFLYFGYSKNATNGFFDTTALGLNVPVVKLDPVTAAGGKFVYGGYYSPTFFMMNAGRADLQGSLFHKMIEYKIGGSLGVQTTYMGHGIHAGSGSRLSSAFDGNVIYNMTDWLAAYGDVDFLNAGGQFNRWRFGGGLILRPHIDALSPMFGKPKMSKAATK
jgi:tetratricopeptide (TPR) repeat protein